MCVEIFAMVVYPRDTNEGELNIRRLRENEFKSWLATIYNIVPMSFFYF